MKPHKYSELAKTTRVTAASKHPISTRRVTGSRMDMAVAVLVGVVSGFYLFQEPLKQHRASMLSSSSPSTQQSGLRDQETEG
jgi:hypothetical protein